MVEIGVLRTGKALPYILCFLLVAYSWVVFFLFFFFLVCFLFWFGFFSSLITFFKDRTFFTSGLLDKINSYERMVHIFVLIIPHSRTVSAREPIKSGKAEGGGGGSLSQVGGGGCGPRAPRPVKKVIRLPH